MEIPRHFFKFCFVKTFRQTKTFQQTKKHLDKPNKKPEERPGAVYKIQCSDRQATYIGETGRN